MMRRLVQAKENNHNKYLKLNLYCKIFHQEVIFELKKSAWGNLYCAVAKHGYLAACGNDGFFVLNLATNE